MKWSKEAEEAIARVPFFVRRRVRKRVEEEAVSRGAKEVTMEHVSASRRQYMNNMEEEVKGYSVEACFSMQKKKSYYVREAPIGGIVPWSLILESPVSSYQGYIYAAYTRNLSVLLLLSVFTVALSAVISRRMAAPLRELQDITADLPQELAAGGRARWPESGISEIASLVKNFRAMSERLGEKFQEIGEANKNLGQRSAELALLNERLDHEKRALRVMSRAVESSISGIAIADLRGKLVYVNPSFVRMWGYASEKEILGRNAADFRLFGERARQAMEALNREGLWVEEAPVAREDGSQFFFQVSANLIYDEGGSPISMQASFIDITERREAEEEVERYKGHLESLVEERTAKLANAVRRLNSEILERIRAEEIVQASLKEKEALLREVHHRVKNNLQVISSLLNIQSGFIKDPKSLEIFNESRQRVRSMALIHEKLYRSDNLAGIDFSAYVQSLSEELFRSYGIRSGSVALRREVQDVFLGIDTAIPCGLIINELLSNSLKHAFPDGRSGEVRVLLKKDDDKTYCLIVSDNGIGLPDGYELGSRETLGLRLVQSFVRQLGGTVEVTRGRGSAFKIVFPEHRYRERFKS